MAHDDEDGSADIVGIPLDCIDGLSKVRLYMPKDMTILKARKTTLLAVGETVKRLKEVSGTVPLLDPKEDMKVCGSIYLCLIFVEDNNFFLRVLWNWQVSDSKYRKLHRKIEHLQSQMEDEDVSKDEDFEEKLTLFLKKQVRIYKALWIAPYPSRGSNSEYVFFILHVWPLCHLCQWKSVFFDHNAGQTKISDNLIGCCCFDL